MPVSDELKKLRSNNYGGDKKPEGPQDPDEENDTSRIIKLSDDEQKAFEGAKPGQELVCEVRGNLEEDGHFHVMSVSAPQGQPYGSDENQMASQIAGLPQPRLAPSPS